jgi:hypothetical protein
MWHYLKDGVKIGPLNVGKKEKSRKSTRQNRATCNGALKMNAKWDKQNLSLIVLGWIFGCEKMVRKDGFYILFPSAP